MNPLAVTFGLSLGICILIVMTQRMHGHLTFDHTDGVQKFHENAVPRVGGIGLYIGLLAAWPLMEREISGTLEAILLAGLPALLFGLAEDITGRVSILSRLLATIASGLIVCLITNSTLNHVDIPVVDNALALPLAALAFSSIAIGGLANSINIIDGFNGLASGTVAICSAALSMLALSVGDTELGQMAALLAVAMAGFWLVNFPFGRIFLGDGGAYFGGFALAWIAIELPMRNPELSPWHSLLVCAYPVIETLYSIVRRVLSRKSPGEPDAMHLHSLIMVCFVKPRFGHWTRSAQHALVSFPLWVFAALSGVLANALEERPVGYLLLACTAMVVIYHLAHQSLVQRTDSRSTVQAAGMALQPIKEETRPKTFRR